jgi:D-3-phosphoglycerate dehydrogenase
MTTNKKTVLCPATMDPAGKSILTARGDVELIEFPVTIASADFQALLAKQAQANASILGATPFGEKEVAASKGLQVVARIGVGFDAVDVPALTRVKVPLMVAGTANSPSVAEQAMFMILHLAKRGAELNAMVQQNRWNDRFGALPFDLYQKNLLVVGFGRIGTRTTKRAQAFEMNVMIYDPYVDAATIRAAGCEPVTKLEDGLARADFVSIHCPKTKETIGLINADRLAVMKSTAFLVNTARGGIVDEAALHKALTTGKLAGAGLDVYASEPVEPDNPLLKLPNVISAPHMAGVTKEAVARMAVQCAKNVLSVFDGQPIAENVINKEVLKS